MKSILDLEPNECRYAVNDGPDYLFCAAPVHFSLNLGKLRQSSYCREHHLICTTVSAPKRAVA